MRNFYLKLLVVVITIALIYCILFLLFKERNTYECMGCLSKKNNYQWHFGSWGSRNSNISLTDVQEVIVESFTYKKYLNKTKHNHNWQYSQGAPYLFFGTLQSGCALGSKNSRNSYAAWFEYDKNFRVFIKSKEDSGVLKKKESLQLLILPRALPDGGIPLKEYSQKVLKLEGLVDEYFDL